MIKHGFSLFSDLDIFLFKAGRHFKLYEKLGSHLVKNGNEEGVYFAVWAPNAASVSVIGDFNGWNENSHPLGIRWDSSGIWEGFIPNLKKGTLYKYFIRSSVNNYSVQKADPFALYSEIPPKTASIVWDLNYTWGDSPWMEKQKEKNFLDAPLSIYEVHLGSWKRKEDNSFLDYRTLALELADYVKKMGFTHIELLPIMEHPFYGSWGYETLNYFAPTSRYGDPQGLMFFIETLHQNGIGVFLDWVGAHFPDDPHGLAFFDGTHLFEHEDKRKGVHPDWNSLIFNYGRKEVQSFLISSTFYWAEKYHFDGLRMDAVASMLYLDYSRKNGEWIPNCFGGNHNLEAISFLQEMNLSLHEHYPGVVTIAEESTAWPMVTRPVESGGLGFHYKWNMGWMHDTLEYFSKDPVYRKHHHYELTFSLIYAFHENFILVLSHDEVVHGKKSLLEKMPNDEWQKFANQRLIFGYQYTHPGKKLLFMGMEHGEKDEWEHERSLSWNFPKDSYQEGLIKWVRDLNTLYRSTPALFKKDFTPDGFEWIDCNDWEKSIISYLRKDNDYLLAICNFTPIVRKGYRIGVPLKKWKEVLNSDDPKYNGSGVLNPSEILAEEIPMHERELSIALDLPPLGITILRGFS